MATAKLKISGMSCEHCVRAVENALHVVEGVTRADVDLGGGQATVEYDAARTTPRALANAVTDEGYPAEELA